MDVHVHVDWNLQRITYLGHYCLGRVSVAVRSNKDLIIW